MAKQNLKILDSHPIANIWPLLSDRELQDLVDDIQQNGLLHPVVLYEGKILDGRNRARACELAGVAIKTTKYRGDDPIGYAFSLNEKRRHLTTSQRAALAAEAKPMYEAEAKKRQQAAGGNHNPFGKNQHTKEDGRSLVEKIPSCSPTPPGFGKYMVTLDNSGSVAIKYGTTQIETFFSEKAQKR